MCQSSRSRHRYADRLGSGGRSRPGSTPVNAKARARTNGGGPDAGDTREIVIDKDGLPVKSHEAVCTEEEWEGLRLLLKPQPLKRTRARAGGLPLVGLVYCGVCGTKMTSNRSLGESGAYLCGGRMKGADCPGIAINAGAVEQFIREVVAGSLDNPEIREFQAERLHQASAGSMSTQLADLHAQADTLEESIGILQAQVKSAPAVAMSALLARIGEEVALKNQLDLRIAEKTEGRPRDIPDISGAEFLERDPATQKSITRTFIRKIVIDADDARRGAVKGMFGSQGTNLGRIGFWFLGDGDEEEPRRGSGYSLLPTNGAYPCPLCEEPRTFRYKNNLRHHLNYANPKPVPCPECAELFPLPGLPSHRRNKHGVQGVCKQGA